MENNVNPAVLAIDGGGSRCRIALQRGSDIEHVQAGSANISTNFDAAISTIRDAMTELARRSGWPLERLQKLPAYVGLAGVISLELAEKVKTSLALQNAVVTDDRPIALRAALGNEPGFLAHCGTGSFWAMQDGINMRFVGGWGPVLGDDASAQWVGRRALTITLATADGLRRETSLARSLMHKFGGTSGVVAFAASATPFEFGQLATMVTEHANAQDPIAIEVMSNGANEIAAGLKALGWRTGSKICLGGGIGPHYLNFLPPELASCSISPMSEPLIGALSLAQDHARTLMSPAIKPI